jgi:hypothetical protein
MADVKKIERVNAYCIHVVTDGGSFNVQRDEGAPWVSDITAMTKKEAERLMGSLLRKGKLMFG